MGAMISVGFFLGLLVGGIIIALIATGVINVCGSCHKNCEGCTSTCPMCPTGPTGHTCHHECPICETCTNCSLTACNGLPSNGGGVLCPTGSVCLVGPF